MARKIKANIADLKDRLSELVRKRPDCPDWNRGCRHWLNPFTAQPDCGILQNRTFFPNSRVACRKLVLVIGPIHETPHLADQRNISLKFFRIDIEIKT